MPIRITPGSTPNTLKLSKESKSLEIKASHVAHSALYAAFMNTSYKALGNGTYFERARVIDLTDSRSADRISTVFIKSRDLERLERNPNPSHTINPLHLEALSGYKKSREAPSTPTRTISKTLDEESPAEEPVSPRGSSPTESIASEPIALTLEPSLPTPQELSRDENKEIRKALSEISGEDLTEASYSKVMQVVSSPSFERSAANLELVDWFIATVKANPFPDRPLTPLAKTIPVAPPKRATLREVRKYALDFSREVPQGINTAALSPAVHRVYFLRTLETLRRAYGIDLPWAQLNRCKTAHEALELEPFKQLSLVPEAKLHPEEREFIATLKKNFINNFPYRNA